jgi:hypothetical protein
MACGVIALVSFGACYWKYGGPFIVDAPEVVAKNAALANGWVTNCTGPVFDQVSPDGRVGLGPDRPVFKISDQLVLAIPKRNWPNASPIDREPSSCRSPSDLPKTLGLFFYIWGNWSMGYKPEDIPNDGDRKQFAPDRVWVHIGSELPRVPSDADRRAFDEMDRKSQDELLDKQTIGGLTCGRHPPRSPLTDKYKYGGLSCWGPRASSDPEQMSLGTHQYDWPFIQIWADDYSTRYGGVHIVWTVWTQDLSHAREIDAAVWKAIDEWNLVSKSEVQGRT